MEQRLSSDPEATVLADRAGVSLRTRRSRRRPDRTRTRPNSTTEQPRAQRRGPSRSAHTGLHLGERAFLNNELRIYLVTPNKCPTLFLRVVGYGTIRAAGRSCILPSFGFDQALGILKIAVDTLNRRIDTIFL